jgi:hypothetical protein
MDGSVPGITFWYVDTGSYPSLACVYLLDPYTGLCLVPVYLPLYEHHLVSSQWASWLLYDTPGHLHSYL